MHRPLGFDFETSTFYECPYKSPKIKPEEHFSELLMVKALNLYIRLYLQYYF